jgi:hypothetical protein
MDKCQPITASKLEISTSTVVKLRFDCFSEGQQRLAILQSAVSKIRRSLTLWIEVKDLNMSTDRSWEALVAALEQLRHALELLDAAAAPPHIGAHVDLAIQQLYSDLTQRSAGSAFSRAGLSPELQ